MAQQQDFKQRLEKGQQLARQMQFEAAALLFQSLVDDGANEPDIFVELGYALKDAQQHEAAARALQRGLEIAPASIRLLNAYGLVLTDLKRLEQALVAFESACRSDPQSAGSWSNLARTLLALGRPHEAADRARQALRLDGALIQALQTLRAALFQDKQIDEAIALCETLVAQLDMPVATLGLRATCFEDLGMHREALELWLKFAETGTGGKQAVFNAALCALRLEDYQLGWKLWAQRPLDRVDDLASHGMSVPYWTGEEPLRDRTLFIYPEQGFGDCIQFARYVPELDALRPAALTLAFPPALEPLYRNLDSVRVLKQGHTVGHADLQCSVANLPSCLLVARGEIAIPPPRRPNLDPSRVVFWSGQLGHSGRRRIGIATSGNPAHHNDRNRSIALASLQPLVSPSFELICLQRELRDSDQVAAQSMDVRFFGKQIQDFSDAAALASLCDAVVSVDSAPAHMAASMGIKTFLLLPYLADWRWGTSDQSSVWYPSARLFRQNRNRDWRTPIAELATALHGI